MSLLQLHDGPLIRQDALLLALRLEDAGYTMSITEGKLSVSPGSKLSAADRAAIGACKAHLVALVGYCQEGHEAR